MSKISAFLANALQSVTGSNQVEEVNHLKDLQQRLQLVAYKAKSKGKRKPLSSTASYAMSTKQQTAKDKHSSSIQFCGSVDSNGLHKFFKKNNVYLTRT